MKKEMMEKMMEKMENIGKVRMTRREKEQMIVQLYEDGYSYKEICHLLRVSPKTITKVLEEAETSKQFEIYERLDNLEERIETVERALKALILAIQRISNKQ